MYNNSDKKSNHACHINKHFVDYSCHSAPEQTESRWNKSQANK